MKKKICVWGSVLLFFMPGLALAVAPHEIGGFVLGGNIADFQKMVKMETALPIRYAEYLQEVEIKNLEGFKSGLITYGTCETPGRIVRIKLKYADSTPKFFQTILERYKELFGEPAEWRGDPFHVIIAWKWSFTDSQNNQISLILQHNTMDEEEKLGNSVKLTLTNLMEKERLCFEKKHPEPQETSEKSKPKPKGKESVDWSRLLPR